MNPSGSAFDTMSVVYCACTSSLMFIGIKESVILLYNNKEKETSAGHENKPKGHEELK